MPSRGTVPIQDGYYFVVVIECPVSTHGLLNMTHCSDSGLLFVVNSSALSCPTLFCPILPHFIRFSPKYTMLMVCPVRGQEGECQFELEGCLEEVWLTWA